MAAFINIQRNIEVGHLSIFLPLQSGEPSPQVVHHLEKGYRGHAGKEKQEAKSMCIGPFFILHPFKELCCDTCFEL